MSDIAMLPNPPIIAILKTINSNAKLFGDVSKALNEFFAQDTWSQTQTGTIPRDQNPAMALRQSSHILIEGHVSRGDLT